MHQGGVSLNEPPCSLPNAHQLPTAAAEPHQLLDEQTSKVRQQVAASQAMLPNKLFVFFSNLSITDATSSSEAKLTSTSCSSRHCQCQHGTWSSRQTHNPQGSPPSVRPFCMYVNIHLHCSLKVHVAHCCSTNLITSSFSSGIIHKNISLPLPPLVPSFFRQSPSQVTIYSL